jgi:hypothetical protein
MEGPLENLAVGFKGIKKHPDNGVKGKHQNYYHDKSQYSLQEKFKKTGLHCPYPFLYRGPGKSPRRNITLSYHDSERLSNKKGVYFSQEL